jgi:protein transport protein SEC20
MQGELSRSRFAQETLEQSTAALEDLGEKYSDLNTLLANSKNLVSTLLKSTKSDTWYLETTFYILITTVIWLVFRRWLYGPLTWFLIWPLKLVFRIVFGAFGLATASTAASSSVDPPKPSTSLIIQPSATGGIPKHRNGPNNQQPQHYVRVGGGGRGYMHHGADPSPPNSYSQQVGKMAEQKQQQEEVPDHPQFRQPRQEVDDGPVRRGDGTILKESDKPRNPKKKMWEENVESAKHEAKQAEAAAAAGETGETRKRDEL